MGGLTAEIVEEPVVCPHEFGVDGWVLMSPDGAGDEQLDVHALLVHVPEAGLHDPFGVSRRELGAHELLGAAPGLGGGACLSQGAGCVLPPAACCTPEVVAVGRRVGRRYRRKWCV